MHHAIGSSAVWATLALAACTPALGGGGGGGVPNPRTDTGDTDGIAGSPVGDGRGTSVPDTKAAGTGTAGGTKTDASGIPPKSDAATSTGAKCESNLTCACGEACNDFGTCQAGAPFYDRLCCGNTNCDKGQWCTDCHCFELDPCGPGYDPCNGDEYCSGGYCRCKASSACGYGEVCVGGACLKSGKVCPVKGK